MSFNTNITFGCPDLCPLLAIKMSKSHVILFGVNATINAAKNQSMFAYNVATVVIIVNGVEIILKVPVLTNYWMVKSTR